jgi:hypothetical protein
LGVKWTEHSDSGDACGLAQEIPATRDFAHDCGFSERTLERRGIRLSMFPAELITEDDNHRVETQRAKLRVLR